MGKSKMIANMPARWIGAAAASLLATGCVSLGGGEPPESLLTLSPTGTSVSAETQDASEPGALAVLTPDAPARLDVLRVPVAVSDTEIAYLQDAVWVEKPARLFRRLVGETLRGNGTMMVLDGEDISVTPTQYLRGTLLDMTYDASAGAVVVRFDAIHTDDNGNVRNRRFEVREDVTMPEARVVGLALNRSANAVAQQVADWIAETGEMR